MRKILASLLVIGVVGAAGVAASSAFFTDTETSTNNTITSGTLALEVNDNDSSGTFVFNLGDITGMMPGGVSDEATIKIQNMGTTDLAWFGYFETSEGAMDEAFYIDSASMRFLDNNGGTEWETFDHFITNGTGSGAYGSYYTSLANLDPFHVVSFNTFNGSSNNMMGAGYGVFMGALKPGGYAYELKFKVGMAPLANNTYQNNSMNLKYVVHATSINAAALDSLFTAPRFVGNTGGVNHITWLNQQIAKQN